METPVDYHKTEDGALRWDSNDRVVPESAMNDYKLWNLVDPEQHKKIEAKEDSESIADYIESQKNRVYTEEEKYEMQAAFGGEEVVDIFTGKKINY